MRRPVVPVLFLLLVLAVTATVAVIIGWHQLPSAWSVLLRLDDCELPCWIGVVPGRTTLGEAQELVEAAYADDSLYLLETHEHFQYFVTYKPTGHRIGIDLSSEGQIETPQSQVRIIWLMPRPRQNSSSPDRWPILAELHSGLGDAVAVRLSSGIEAPSVAVFFEDERVHMFVDQLECEKILLDQEIRTIVIWDEMPISGYAFKAGSMAWLRAMS